MNWRTPTGKLQIELLTPMWKAIVSMWHDGEDWWYDVDLRTINDYGMLRTTKCRAPSFDAVKLLAVDTIRGYFTSMLVPLSAAEQQEPAT